MAVKERRKDSFLTYPVETTQTIESLTDAGYFYAAGNISHSVVDATIFYWFVELLLPSLAGEHSKPQEGGSNGKCGWYIFNEFAILQDGIQLTVVSC